MKLYTFQRPAWWTACRQNGYYVADTSFIFDESMKAPYNWMLEQYKKRIHQTSASALIWVWKEIPEGYRDGATDWDIEEGYKENYLFVFEHSEKDVLWSCYNAWHVPLNDGRLTSADEETYEDTLPKRYGWERVFDFNWLIKHEYSDGATKQGVIDYFTEDELCAVYRFNETLNTWDLLQGKSVKLIWA
ncbi:hypothetical protein CN514_06670 [Bacillus sp. AFS001701]|uniref:DUF3841 domain-containing protein n=1 Tax=Bacillus sp. AFS001701 TaxID=2033480 RepID=UPI000BF3A047|nr:DUF3841 domain-containing protein [Bacillus sp. AFS001701]PET71562.1 hypothetical protein CN514_06670 [Bacillus sp. AFS001701]